MTGPVPETEAVRLAVGYCRVHGLHAERAWRAERFEQGWILSPLGDDLEGWSGIVGLVVLDDGRIYHDNLSAGLDVIARRFARWPEAVPPPPLDRGGAVGQAVAYAGRHLTHLGPRTWHGERFGSGWLLRPEGEDLRWRFDLPAVVALDDGRVFEDSGSMPSMFVVERYEAMLAREAAQRAED